MFNKKIILMLAIILVSLLAVSAVSAADNAISDIVSVEETTTDAISLDELDEVVSVEDIQVIEQTDNDEVISEVDNGTFTALQNKIDNAEEGSTITLENDYAYDDGFDTVGIQITKPLTINGNGHTLDGLKMSRIFEVKSDVVLNDICFINGNSSRGGAISSTYSCPEFTINNCIFNNNEASDYGGGAVYAYKALNITNSTFISNRASDGGAIDGGDELYVKDSEFIDNYAENYGGAISTAYLNNIISNCIFKNNEASDYGGGAIYDSSVLLNIVNSTFISNRANNGGAIYKGGFVSEDGDDLFVKDSEFIDNYAKKDGGAILFNSYETSTVSVYDIAGNVAGSKIVVTYRNSSIENSVFTNNSAKSTGGAICGLIYNSSGIPNGAKAINCNFTHNYAMWGGTDFAGGMVINCIFTDTWGSHDQSLEDAEEVNCTYNAKIDISIYDVTKYYGDSQNLLISVYEDYESIKDADVKIMINNEEFSKTTDSDGQISLDLNWDVGTYEVACEYKGFKVTSIVTVKSTLTTNDATGMYLNSKVTSTFLNVDGKALASKQVTFKIDGKEYAATTNANGVATAGVDLGAGTYHVTAVNPVNKEEKTFKLVINKASSKIALASDQKNGVVTLTAALTPATATGNVVFNVNSENKNAQISNGKATLTLRDLEPGNYTVTASYSGDKNLNASTSNTVSFSAAEVYPILTAEDLTKTYGNADKFVVNLIDSKGNAIANALVNVDIKGKVTPITTGSDGRATMPVTLAPAEYTATVTYADMQTTAKITVKKATPKMTAKAKTFKKSVKTKKYTVTLKTNKNKVMKNKKITVKVNKKTYSAKTNSKGVATFKITKLTKKGKYTATVTYSGSSYYNKLTKKVKITVK